MKWFSWVLIGSAEDDLGRNIKNASFSNFSTKLLDCETHRTYSDRKLAINDFDLEYISEKTIKHEFLKFLEFYFHTQPFYVIIVNLVKTEICLISLTMITIYFYSYTVKIKPRVTTKWFLAKPRSFSNLPALLDLNGIFFCFTFKK